MAHHDPVRPTDHGEILRRTRQLRQQVAEETQRVAVTITAAKGLRETLVELAERVAAVHDDRSSLCDRLAGHHLFPRHYWPSQAARACRIAATERQVASHYRRGQTPPPRLHNALVEGLPRISPIAEAASGHSIRDDPQDGRRPGGRDS